MATSPSLDTHLEPLYALARVLAGTDEAEVLIEQVYRHATDVPPSERPSEVRGWLFGLMMEAREGTLRPSNAESSPASEPSFTDDPFRREIAEQTARQKLPVAFAACSIHERLILAIDVLGEPSDDVLAEALDASPSNAREVRDQARSALRASLRDILQGPERMLVDVALPDEALRTHLHDVLVDRFHPAPASLQSTVTDLLDRARAEQATDAPSDTTPSLLDRLTTAVSDNLSLRGIIGGVAFLLVVGGAIGGASYLFSSSASEVPSQTVVDLSVQQASGVEVSLQTNTPSEAAAYIRDNWNRRVSVPSIAEATLTGVGKLSFPPNLTVPALQYADASGSDIVALAFNYALVDRLGGQATLERTLRKKLATNNAVLARERNDRAVVLWRQRDDIFVLVAPNLPADSLRDRIRL